jgi:hypothetical protein
MNSLKQYRNKTKMFRKSLTAMVAAAFLVPLLPANAVDKIPDQTSLTYSIERKGSKIGTHSVSYDFTGENQIAVDIEARVRIKMAFITVYKLDHSSQELWKSGELVKMTSETQRNSSYEEVDLRAADDHYVVEADGETVLAPRDLVPSSFTKTDFWIDEGSKDFMLLDTLSGLMRPSRLEAKGRLQLDNDDQTVDARYYTITNLDENSLSHEFWIDDAGYLIIGTLYTKDGETLTYRFEKAKDKQAA